MGQEPLRRIIYVSTAVHDFSDDEVAALAEGSAKRNAEKGITGVLLYKGGSFLQVIEGPVAAMSELFERLENDTRHTFIEILLDERATHRFFSNWQMRLCNLDSAPPPATTEFMTIAQFISRCELKNSFPVVKAFIHHFSEGSMLSVENPAA